MTLEEEKVPLRTDLSNETDDCEKERSTCNNLFKRSAHQLWERRYLSLVVVGSFFNALRNLLSKIVVYDLDPVMVGWTERTTMMLCCIPGAVWYRHSLKIPFQMVRASAVAGVLSATQIILAMESYKFLSVGDASVIVSCNPVIVMFLSWVFLAEKISGMDIVACFSAVIGITLLSRPVEMFNSSILWDFGLLFGFLAALGTAVSIAVGGVLRRYLCLNEVNRHISLMYINVIGCLMCAMTCTLLQKWKFPKEGNYAYLISSGICGYLNNLLIMIALRSEKASHVFLVGTLMIPMVFVLQFLFLQVEPDIYSLFGTVFTLLAVILISQQKRETHPEKSTHSEK